jgi:hypothetical protein
MNVIIDECVPHIVKRRLHERQIKTVQEMGLDFGFWISDLKDNHPVSRSGCHPS